MKKFDIFGVSIAVFIYLAVIAMDYEVVDGKIAKRTDGKEKGLPNGKMLDVMLELYYLIIGKMETSKLLATDNMLFMLLISSQPLIFISIHGGNWKYVLSAFLIFMSISINDVSFIVGRMFPCVMLFIFLVEKMDKDVLAFLFVSLIVMHMFNQIQLVFLLAFVAIIYTFIYDLIPTRDIKSMITRNSIDIKGLLTTGGTVSIGNVN